MKYANIEIGTKEVVVYSASALDGRLTQQCAARGRLHEVYNQGLFCLDVESIISTAIEGLRQAGKVDAVTITGFVNAVVVLDENDELLLPCLAMRDGSIDHVKLDIDPRELFDQSGMVVDPRSALHQLLALKAEEPHLFERAGSYMFLPDYIRFRLTGIKATDYSLAQANGMTLVESKDWNSYLFAKVDLANHFPPFAEDGTILGSLNEDVVKEIGYEAEVYSIPSNAVVLAADTLDLGLFITSYLGGRIALVNDGPILNDEIFSAQGKNLTVDGGKNIILLPFGGYGLIDRVRRQSVDGTTFDTIEDIARDNKVFEYIDIRDERLQSGDIIEEVNTLLEEQDKEKTEREVAIGVLYNSIARYTVGSIRILDELNEARSSEVSIIGQAAKDYYLNSLICMHSAKSVISSAGFFASSFAALHLMIKNGEIEKKDAKEMIRRYYGISSFNRAEEE